MDIYWRDSQRSTRFFFFDAKASFPVVLFLFHMRLWTLIFAFIVMLLFWGLERKGLNFTTAMRTIRGLVIGKYRPKSYKLEKHTMKDYG